MSERAKCKHQWLTWRDENGKFLRQDCEICGAKRPSKKDIEYAEFHARRLGLAGADDDVSNAVRVAKQATGEE